jgi:hypothetical protein
MLRLPTSLSGMALKSMTSQAPIAHMGKSKWRGDMTISRAAPRIPTIGGAFSVGSL